MANRPTALRLLLLGALLAVSCTNTVPPTRPTTSARPKVEASVPPAVATSSPAASAAPLVSPSPSGPAVTPSPAASTMPVAQATYWGRVIGLDGSPVANVSVAGLISDSGGGLVGNKSGGYRILQAALTVKTDAKGEFRLTSPDGKPLNIEAVLEPTIKAIKLAVPANAAMIDLQLAHTGSITGKVTAPEAPGVTDFLGVDVFIPGTSYTAKADAGGQYTLNNVPVGSFTVIGSKTGLGSARVDQVAVTSKAVTTAPNLPLIFKAPKIASVTPTIAGPGAEITIKGENFKLSSGETFSVLFGGVTATQPVRVDDQTITAQVPAGAQNGNVVVTVEGIQSNASSFRVIKAITTSLGNFFLPVGSDQAFTYSAVDTAGVAVAEPGIVATVDGTVLKLRPNLVASLDVGIATINLVAGSLTQSVRVVVTAGQPIVGNLVSGLGDPRDMAFDSAGNLLFVDQNTHDVRKVFLAGAGAGTVGLVAGTGNEGYLDGPALQAQFNQPGGIAIGPDGTIYIADDTNPRIRRIKPDGNVDTLAGSGEAGFKDGAGAVAQFHDPHGMALDGKGFLYVADRENHSIRRIDLNDSAHPVITVAGADLPEHVDGPGAVARFNSPDAVVFDGQGRLVVSDDGNHCLRLLTFDAAGNATASTWVGQPKVAGYSDRQGASALLNSPHGLAFDKKGNLFFTDSGNRRVRMVTPDGYVLGFAGTGEEGATNGPPFAANFDSLRGIAVGADGAVYVADKDNDDIRRIK